MDLLSLRESTGPVVASPSAMLRQVDVLWVVELGIGGVEDGVEGFQGFVETQLTACCTDQNSFTCKSKWK